MRAFGVAVAVLLALVATAMLAAWLMGWEVSGEWGDTRGPRLVQLALLTALFSSGIVVALRQRFSETLFSLIAWGGAFLLLILAYSYRAEFKEMWARIRGEVLTGEVVTIAPGEVQLRRGEDGHFHAEVRLNGADVTMMIDTGASGIALSWADARAAGLAPETLNFVWPVATASGRANAAQARLSRIEVGPIVRENMPALVLPEGSDQSLLGLDFLNSLRSYEIAGDRLTLRY
ncbi:hypothetical protein sos41_30140 [Alphaproteobacteria bacterium SO-S41]|nr:hypothetical protein sos41_30140 [Alphaproteobacteria bacterium SO-S41]